MAKLKLKLTTLLLITLLLLFSTISHSARPDSTFSPQPKVHVDSDGEESCEGVEEQECLMRRTLVAHLDYIYTQNHKP